MTEHSYKYSITRITDDITTVVETDDRAFAYEFTHGMPEIDVVPDCTNISIDAADIRISNDAVSFHPLYREASNGRVVNSGRGKQNG